MMILAAMLALALVLAAPLALAFRPPIFPQNRREAALATHRAQLAELTREHEQGRIGAAEYKAARLEVERRLLAADALAAPPLTGNAKPLLIAVMLLLPLAAFALYLPGGTPAIPSEPHAQWVARQAAAQAKLAQMVILLRAHLAGVDPDSADASQGQAYLAEALSEQAGRITPEALALFRQSLAHAPPGASWRALDEQRITEAESAASQ
jgi:cytochrome c-type biogenesis protein CcmH